MRSVGAMMAASAPAEPFPKLLPFGMVDGKGLKGKGLRWKDGEGKPARPPATTTNVELVTSLLASASNRFKPRQAASSRCRLAPKPLQARLAASGALIRATEASQ